MEKSGRWVWWSQEWSLWYTLPYGQELLHPEPSNVFPGGPGLWAPLFKSNDGTSTGMQPMTLYKARYLPILFLHVELLVKRLSTLILPSSSQVASSQCGFLLPPQFLQLTLMETHLLFQSWSQFYFHPTSSILSFVLALVMPVLSLGSDLDSASDFCFSTSTVVLTSWKGMTPVTDWISTTSWGWWGGTESSVPSLWQGKGQHRLGSQKWGVVEHYFWQFPWPVLISQGGLTSSRQLPRGVPFQLEE